MFPYINKALHSSDLRNRNVRKKIVENKLSHHFLLISELASFANKVVVVYFNYLFIYKQVTMAKLKADL